MTFSTTMPDCCDHVQLQVLETRLIAGGTKGETREQTLQCQSCFQPWESVQDTPAGDAFNLDPSVAVVSKSPVFYRRAPGGSK